MSYTRGDSDYYSTLSKKVKGKMKFFLEGIAGNSEE